ncbi:MAG: hypothetical protein AAGD09_06400 [Cyanobacteria bacterium P01_F01_bin.56]
MKPPFNIRLSHPSLDYCPGGEPARFWLALQNHSPTYASFQFHLQAAGEAEPPRPTWYRLVGADAYTLPPNDCVKFEVEILSLPPQREGFVGVLCLQAMVSSPELRASASETLKLYVTGIPPQFLPQSEALQTPPDALVEIPVHLKNPNDQPISLDLRLEGLPATWLEQAQHRLLLPPNVTERSTFRCTVPPVSDARQGLYPFAIKVLQSEAVTASQTATLEVLPTGAVEVSCEMAHQDIPAQPGRWLNRHRKPATYTLHWSNQSNNSVQGTISIQAKSDSRRWWQRPPRQTKIVNIGHVPDSIDLAIAAHHTSQVNIEYRPPWWGWGSYQEFQIQDYAFEPPTELVQANPILSLKLRPVIPRWLQSCGLLGLIVSSWLLLSQGHRATVNHVEFPHQTHQIGDENHPQNFRNIVSGAENGTLLAWPLRNHLRWLFSQHFNPLNPSDRKAIEVVRYSPDNKQVAVGHASGEIKLYDWESRDYRYSLDIEAEKTCSDRDRFLGGKQVYRGDRVFDLIFSSDSQFLYSTHGSGRIVKWNLAVNPPAPECLQSAQNDAVTAATLVRQRDQYWLAAAGQRNHLKLVDLDSPFIQQRLFPLDIKENSSTPSTDESNEANSSETRINSISKDDAITSLASPQNRPSLLAVADNQGNITLLDLDTCGGDLSTCSKLKKWSAHGGLPIRAVAFTDDGCYLASAGDDGNVELWQLQSVRENASAVATVLPELVPGKEYDLRTSRQRFSRHPLRSRSLETVDIVRLTGAGQDILLIASGGEDRQVRLQTIAISRLTAHFDDEYPCPAP